MTEVVVSTLAATLLCIALAAGSSARGQLPPPTPELVPVPEKSNALPAPTPSSPLQPIPIDPELSPETLLGLEPSGPMPVPNIWFSGEYLCWWLTRVPQPFVTTSSDPNAIDSFGIPNSGAPGLATTSVIFGGGDSPSNPFSGGRFSLGLWFDPHGHWGGEVTGLFLGERGASYGITDPALLALPYFDVATGEPASVILTDPGVNTGQVNIFTSQQLWGLELHALHRWWSGPASTVDLLVGVRYLDLRESLEIDTATFAVSGGAVPFLANPASATATSDFFYTRNQFVGPQLGLRGRWQLGNAYMNLTGKIALGDNLQLMEIQGLTSAQGVIGTSTATGGIYAQSSNIGIENREVFAAVSEIEWKIGYYFSPNWQAVFGYNFMYWSSVARAANQLNTTLDIRTIPTSFVYDPTVTSTFPTRNIHETSLFLHGFSVGLVFTY